MKFTFIFFDEIKIFQIKWNFYFIYNRTAFYLAVEKKNPNVVKLLLSSEKIDFNIPYVFIKIYF